jgi:hypothetical protein
MTEEASLQKLCTKQLSTVADLAENIGGCGKYELNIIIEIHKSYIQFHPKKISPQ